MRFHSPARILSAAVLATSAACGSDGSTAPTQSRADLNQAFVELGIPALATVTATVNGVPSVSPSIADRSPCAYTTGTQSFVCPTQTISGLTIAASYTLLSASGSPQPAFDPAATAAVRTDASAAGTLTSAGTSLTIDTKQTLTLNGLLSDHHVLDGTGTTKVNGTVAQGSTSVPVSVNGTTTIAKLVFPPTGSASKWPLSGTITSESSTSVSGLPAIPAKVVVTFDGSSKAAVVITVASSTTHCTVDLANQNTTCSG